MQINKLTLYKNILSFFQHQKPESHTRQKPLDHQELQDLQLLAEQLNSSTEPTHYLDSQQAGWLASKALGSGMDYAESRVYQSGDNPRNINWRLSARSQETFVKTFHRESRPVLCVLLDLRRTMKFGTRIRLKSTQAIRVACLLAYVAELKQVGFQLFIIKDDINWFESLATNDYIHLINQQSQYEIEVKESLITTQVNLQTVFKDLNQKIIANTIPKGSLLYLMSDFSDLQRSDSASFVHFQEHHFVQAIHILDPSELKIPAMGLIHLQNMQSNNESSKYSLNTNKPQQRQEFSEYADEFITKRKKLITESGMTYTQLLTDKEDISQHLSIPLGHG